MSTFQAKLPDLPHPSSPKTPSHTLPQTALRRSTLQTASPCGSARSPAPIRYALSTARPGGFLAPSPWTQRLCRVVLTSAARRHSTGNQTCASRNLQHTTLPVTPAPGQAQPSDSPKATLVTSATGRMLASPSGLAAGRSNQPAPLPPHTSSPPRVTCHGHQDSSPAPPGTQSTHPAAAPTEAPDSGNSCSATHLSPTISRHPALASSVTRSTPELQPLAPIISLCHSPSFIPENR